MRTVRVLAQVTLFAVGMTIFTNMLRPAEGTTQSNLNHDADSVQKETTW